MAATRKTDETAAKRGLFLRTLRYMKPVAGLYILWILTLLGSVLIDTISPILVKTGIDRFATPHTTEGLGRYALLWIPLIVLGGFFIWGEKILCGKAAGGLLYGMRKDLFRRLNSLSVDYFDTARSGWILERFSRDARNVEVFFIWDTRDILMDGGRILFYLTSMLILNWKLALAVVVLAPLFALLTHVFNRMYLRFERSVKRQGSDMTATYTETVFGIRTIKALEQETRFDREYRELSEEFRRTKMRYARVSSVYDPLVYLVGLLCTASVLVFGTVIQRSSGLSLGTMAAFLTYASALYGCINSVANGIINYPGTRASMERYYSLLDRESTVKDPPEIAERYPSEEVWQALPRLAGEIEFRDVTFSYTPDVPLIEHLDLRIPAGQKVALVGETGGGKTTIVNLACRFYEPLSGTILYDGTEHRALPIGYVYSQLGYVLQSPYLFPGTVMENAMYGRKDAVREDVISAAKKLGIHEMISSFPEGYDTQVGEAGDMLSFGQKQLISYLRALVADPRILVLDEATSGLDSATEQSLENATRELTRGRTTLLIAHRLSTARTADRILFVEAGKILEDGNHEALMRLGGRYASIVRAQSVERILEGK